jgi:hypothetical protein
MNMGDASPHLFLVVDPLRKKTFLMEQAPLWEVPPFDPSERSLPFWFAS